jgi:hypothetical protein
MIKEFKKLHNLLNIPPGYDDENRCGFSYNAEERFDDILTILNKTPRLKGIGRVNYLTYSTNNETLETLFNNIQNPKLLYELYKCYHLPNSNCKDYDEHDWLIEEQIYIWNHESGNKVLLIYDAYVCPVSYHYNYYVYFMTFNEIIEKINQIIENELKYILNEDIFNKQQIENKKTQIIKKLYDNNNI